MEADKDWDRATSVGMDDVQKPSRRRATRSSSRRQLHTMLPEPGPHDNGRHTSLSGVQSVHCDPVFSRSVNPFVLERRTKRIKKCRGCRKQFVDEKFVVRHEEKVYFVKNNIRRDAIAKVSYHCRPRCIRRRHSDFNTHELVVEPILVNNLTANDRKLFADDEFDLPYIVID